MKEIIPHKLIVSYNPDGSLKSSILQYRIKVDGVIDERKFYTISVKGGLQTAEINKIMADSKMFTETAEKVNG